MYAIVTRSGCAVHLQIRRAAPAVTARSSIERDVYIYVDDVDAVYADLQSRGARVLSPPALAPHGLHELVVEDINGYRVVFGAPPEGK